MYLLGQGQYHPAVAGGCLPIKIAGCACTHPLPRVVLTSSNNEG